jgi:hypothetical protein
MGEFNIGGLEMSDGSAESIENFKNSGTILHGNNSELIFFIDPDEESLGFVMEDTSTGWPVSVEIASSKESISLSIFKKKVRIILLILLINSIGFGKGLT